MSIAVRYYSNEEDQMNMVNTSFMKIIKNIDKYKVGTNYFAWIKQIGKNVVIDEFRKNKNYKSLFRMDESLHHFETMDHIYSPKELEDSIASFQTEEVERILNHLSPAAKITFNLFAIEGYSYKEIADELDVSYETIKWHIKESRKKLKAILTNKTSN